MCSSPRGKHDVCLMIHSLLELDDLRGNSAEAANGRCAVLSVIRVFGSVGRPPGETRHVSRLLLVTVSTATLRLFQGNKGLTWKQDV